MCTKGWMLECIAAGDRPGSRLQTAGLIDKSVCHFIDRNLVATHLSTDWPEHAGWGRF